MDWREGGRERDGAAGPGSTQRTSLVSFRLARGQHQLIGLLSDAPVTWVQATSVGHSECLTEHRK